MWKVDNTGNELQMAILRRKVQILACAIKTAENSISLNRVGDLKLGHLVKLNLW